MVRHCEVLIRAPKMVLVALANVLVERARHAEAGGGDRNKKNKHTSTEIGETFCLPDVYVSRYVPNLDAQVERAEKEAFEMINVGCESGRG